MKVELFMKTFKKCATDEEVKEAMRQAIWKKPACHNFSVSEEMKKLDQKKNIGPCTESVVRSVMK